MNKIPILDYKGNDNPPEQFPFITHECICGSKTFWVAVQFDDYEIGMYSLDMNCVECHARYLAPTPIDHPDYVPEEE